MRNRRETPVKFHICDECAKQPEYKEVLNLIEILRIQGKVTVYQDGTVTQDLCPKHISEKRNSIKWR